MTAFGFDAATRWAARLGKRKSPRRRADDALPFVREDALGGQALLLDTCVYVVQLQGRSPVIVERLIASRQLSHSTVAVAELMHAVGVLDPADPRTAGAVAEIGTVIEGMPAHRLFAPGPDVTGRAALLAGFLCRLQGYGRENRLRAPNDRTLLLQARKAGLTLPTGNVADFDFLLQVVPSGRVLMYRKDAG